MKQLHRIAVLVGFAGYVHATSASASPVQVQVQLQATSRPASVPAEYTVTPNGYFHPSCVYQVAPTEVVQDDGSIRAPDGSVRTRARCAFPHYDAHGALVPDVGARSAAVPKLAYADTAVINGYIGTQTTTELGTVKALSAHWTVPAPPLQDNGQVVYMFNGLESLTTASILQPVLAYYHHHWTAASWNCCKEGTNTTGNTIDVNPGDTIVGTMTGNNCDASTGLCESWTITTTDQNTGQSSVLQTSSWGVPTNWVFAGALEVYGITACGQLPASNAVTFDGQSYTKISGASGTTATWVTDVHSDLQPNCGYYGQSAGNWASFHWDSAGECGKLAVDEQLQNGADLWSCDRRFRLVMQTDGNLVLYQNGSPLWATGTNGKGGYYAVMQGDGNFVVYTNQPTPVWASNTAGHAGATLTLQNDGNLVIYEGSHAIWASNTVVGPAPTPTDPGTTVVTTPPPDDRNVNGGCQAGTSTTAWPTFAIALVAIIRRRRRRC